MFDENYLATHRNVVIYSGGLDSTAVLYMAGMLSSKENPVVTLSVKDHYRFNAVQCRMQTKARRNYIRWARSQGHFIKPYEISVSGNAVGNTALRYHYCLAGLLPMYFRPGDNVYWGIKWNEFHTVPGMLNYLEAFNKFVRAEFDYETVPIKHIFPLRNWVRGSFMEFKIPANCVYSCMYPKKDGRPCKNCCKCDNMSEIYKEADSKPDSMVIDGLVIETGSVRIALRQ